MQKKKLFSAKHDRQQIRQLHTQSCSSFAKNNHKVHNFCVYILLLGYWK